MKLFDEKRTLLSNVENKSKMRIEASSKMFEILSSKIYKYKPAAIVRELSSNCYDSHVEAGIPEKPFTVVLPSKMHSYVEFIDYGTGMSHEDVVNIFTVYGVSTKNNSNSAIGAFGMGAKTPFAYAKSFIVETVKDGIKRFYNLYLDESSEPSYSLQAEVETDEGNGTKIKIPVREEHYHKFVSEAEFILSFFEVRPEINYAGNFEFVVSEEKVKEFYEQGFMRLNIERSESELYNSYRDIYAVMGPVCYPIDFSDIGISSYEISSKLPGLKNDLFSGNDTIFIQFEIGELEVNASREALSIDQDSNSKTVENISNKVKEINDRLLKEFEDHISNASNRVEMLSNLYEYNKSIFEYRGNWKFEIALQSVYYKEKTLQSHLKGTLLGRNINVYSCEVPKSRKRFNSRNNLLPRFLFDNYGNKRNFFVIFEDVETHLTTESWLCFYANEIEYNLRNQDLLVKFKGKKSDLKLERLAKLLPVFEPEDFNVITLSEILSERKRIMRERRASRDVDSISNRPKTEFKAKGLIARNEFYTNYYHKGKKDIKIKIRESRNQVRKPESEKSILYFYLENDSGILPKNLGIKLISFYHKFFTNTSYKEFVLVYKNKMNAKRIEASGIQSFNGLIKKIVSDRKFLRFLKIYDILRNSENYKIDIFEYKIGTHRENELKEFIKKEVLEEGLVRIYYKYDFLENELVNKLGENVVELLFQLRENFYDISTILAVSPLFNTVYFDNLLGEISDPKTENNNNIEDDFPMLKYVPQHNLTFQDKVDVSKYIHSYFE